MKGFISAIVTNGKSVLVTIFITVILSVATLGAGSYAYACYSNAMRVDAENKKMKISIREWKDISAFLDKQKRRPVKQSEIDYKVTSKILYGLQKLNLTLVDFKNISAGADNAKHDYKTFQVSFTGPYADTLRFFSKFYDNESLLTIRQLKIDPQDEQTLRTEITYRVYVK